MINASMTDSRATVELNGRLQAAGDRLQRDLDGLAACRRLEREAAVLSRTLPWSPELEELTWMLEELRISLFAQSLGTTGRISEKRVQRAINQLKAPQPVG